MKTLPILLGLVAATAAISLTGCDTFKSRAAEKSEVFESLPAGTQKRLERGKIRVGDTEDMVYIALGQPDEKRSVANADGNQNTWIYKSYWQQYEGSAWVGWRRIIVPSADRRGFVVYHEPVTRDVYSTHVEEMIRVAFANGRVESVDQRKV